MSSALDYALEVAPDDVADALRWLLDEGFAVVAERGGRSESFGNVLLRLARDASSVQVVRDRSQWSCDVHTEGWNGEHALNVLLTAMRGDVPAPGSRPSDGEAWEQLPPNVLWSGVLPDVLRWGEGGDRADEVSRADAVWRQAMRRFLSG